MRANRVDSGLSGCAAMKSRARVRARSVWPSAKGARGVGRVVAVQERERALGIA